MSSFILKEKEYKKFIGDLITYKADFDAIYSGSSEKFIFRGNTYSLFEKSTSGKGFHLCKMFKKDVDLWLSENSESLEPREHDYKEQYFNLKAINDNIGVSQVAFDISDCYWSVAYKLGFTSYETFIKGKSGGKKWKIGRVASIGSLSKTIVKVPYADGKPVKSLKTVVNTPIEYQYVRNVIIGYVYDMFYRLYQEIGDKQFFMFLTDCVYFDMSQINYVRKFFKARGFKFTVKDVIFIEANEKQRAVKWMDYSQKSEKISKYYQYNDSQLIF